jgi:hypothetical protein
MSQFQPEKEQWKFDVNEHREFKVFSNITGRLCSKKRHQLLYRNISRTFSKVTVFQFAGRNSKIIQLTLDFSPFPPIPG